MDVFPPCHVLLINSNTIRCNTLLHEKTNHCLQRLTWEEAQEPRLWERRHQPTDCPTRTSHTPEEDMMSSGLQFRKSINRQQRENLERTTQIKTYISFPTCFLLVRPL